MKKMKKLFAMLIAMVMVLGMSMSVFAAPAKGTITITPPANASGENTYEIYKVFDATVGEGGAVAYKLLPGVTDTEVPEGFEAANGYVTKAPDNLDEAATVIAGYTKKVLVETVRTTGTEPKASKELDPGYYYISTSTGTAVIVQDGGNVQVKDKNVLSVVKKSAGTQYSEEAKKAIAAVGTSQPFTAQIIVGKGTTKLEFTDTMTNMTYNGDVAVTIDKGTIAATNYTVTGAKGDGNFSVVFKPEYVKTIEDGAVITLSYTATITSSALTTDPAKNTASLKTDNDNTTTDNVEVYNAKITVTKVDKDKQPLAGAKFKLKNADGKYYAGKGTDGAANWTDTGVEVDAALVEGKYTAIFEGLGAGEYTLEESTVPAGYNKAADQTITITAGDFTTTNLEKTAEVVNENGATLPSTGGMGTTIFYALGAVLVIGAGVVLATRRRNAQ